MRYLLEEQLLFDSTEGTLKAVATEESAKLPYASVLVLKVLCENSQILMTRNELMERAWTENGLRASGSNLYNSLSLIRRTILSLGIELQIIRTQPKVGLIMDVAVTLLDEPQPNEKNEVLQAGTVEAESELPAALAQPEPLVLPESRVGVATGQSKIPGKGLPLFLHKLNTNFYLLWTVFIIILLLVIRMTTTQQVDSVSFSPESHSKMGEVEGCTLFRLNEESDIYPEMSVDKKIEKMAKRYKVDCHHKKIHFYIESRVHTHNTYNGTGQLNIICVFNKANDEAIECFNDFHWQQGN